MESFNSFDGNVLNIKVEKVEDPQGVIIICHGLGEHLGRYDYLASKLQRGGFSTYRYDQRGHGHSEGKRAYLRDYYEMPLDLYEMVKKAREDYPHKPLFVLGQSMGALVTLIFASMYPEIKAGYILSGSPGSAMKTYEDLEGKPDDEYIEDEDISAICSDPQVVREWEEDPLTQNAYAVGLFRSLAKGKKYLRENIDKIKRPILLLHGGMDRVVPVEDAWQTFQDLSMEDKALYIYEKQFHEIYHDYLKDRVIGDVISWIDSHR